MQPRTDENALAGELSISHERAIARRYIGRIQWEMILWGLGQLALWLTVLVLGIRGDIPLWLGFPIATFCCGP
jgi:beta-carotene hydroxylase